MIFRPCKVWFRRGRAEIAFLKATGYRFFRFLNPSSPPARTLCANACWVGFSNVFWLSHCPHLRHFSVNAIRHPAGIKAISRGLSETTPTEHVKRDFLTPKVVAARFASTPFEVAESGTLLPGVFTAFKPPATGFNPFRIQNTGGVHRRVSQSSLMPRCLAGSVERHRRIAKVCDRSELARAVKN